MKKNELNIEERKLWTINGFCEDIYEHVDEPKKEIEKKRSLLSLSAWILLSDKKKLEIQSETGVFVPAGEAIISLLPFLENLPLIALDFPSFQDGRAYSVAARLRTIYHYQAELRAVGDILVDQIPFMLRCGFNTFEIMHSASKRLLAQFSDKKFDAFYQFKNRLVDQKSERVKFYPKSVCY